MKYPTGAKKSIKHYNSYSNRGMGLENDIEISNNYYLQNDIAVIYKKPTPITIAKVDYPSRLEAVIKEGYFRTPSTTDYNGIYKGKYIDFEAKETTSKTSFPLSNIHEHQIKHLESIYKHGGIGFLIVRFTKLNHTFLLELHKLLDFLQNNNRKSIPLEYFKTHGYIIKDKYSPRVDYIEIIDKLYFNGGSYEK
ncbi:MAG: Holliday junction resolvase RecU [Bacilli bacterium]|nr:Holliday junction resolvase RecU [Bacilli bacterium]